MQEVNLKTSLQYLKGVGPERAKVFARLGLYTLENLFYFFPRRHENRAPIKRISELVVGEKQCVRAIISGRGLIRPVMRRGAPPYGGADRFSILKVVLQDGPYHLFVMFFNQPYLFKVFTPKTEVILYGTPEKSGKHLQMAHPEYEICSSAVPETIHMGRIVPIYSLTEDLSQKGIRQFVYQAVSNFSSIFRDPLPADHKKRLALVDSVSALKHIHFPKDELWYQRAYRRLVFDEFFGMQLWIQLMRAKHQKRHAAILHGNGEAELNEFIASLPVVLTGAQQGAISEIIRDMKKDVPMNRLVQGDVGSGKTFVGASALFFTVANGFQGALMAPTEVLAQQLYFNLSQLLEPYGIACAYLGSASPAEEKKSILEKIEQGEISVVCGTHALIQEKVHFKKLGLVVIDEQHKFGVVQRAALKDKSKNAPPHFLLMTATPIPRSLAMTLYGDLDISTLNELPKGRKPVRTIWVGESRRKEIYQLLDETLEKKGQAFVICPRIEGSEDAGAKGVVESHEELSRIFSHRKVAVLHGRMKAPEKKKLMQDFKDNKIQLLVSTVVIEVGIDVPNANFMIIENAERFGLSQLHQLRGRVGRGEEQALCVVFSDSANPETSERLDAFQKITSGFEVAEKDLELRGAGDLLGERQHGFPELKIGDFSKDMAVLMLAKKEAQALLEKDPALNLPEHQLLKRVLRARFSSVLSRSRLS